jgi:hypothetical protein
LRKTDDEAMLWVVYRMTVHGKLSGTSAVCEQAEWDAMELAKPGQHMLVRAGITNEGEAERLARNPPVDPITGKPIDLKAAVV